MSMNMEPEPRLEPPENKIAAICTKCGQPIYAGESGDCIDVCVCPDCIAGMLDTVIRDAKITGDYKMLIGWLGL